MADIQKAPCCATSQAGGGGGGEERCVSCRTSCRCAGGPCHCSPSPSLLARPCAGSDVMKSCGAICGCSSQCPCRKAGCGSSAGPDVNLCSGQAGQNVSCTMPGNCGCNKGSLGKL
ncbi:uncharacterized protein LOC143294969 [Babylonia areolata]|uniref:uncharacterized protein LOC143294969 n=1 Tax=Babylonia areolata TaxID=304850 RepID=UPI003FD3CC59